MANQFFSAGSKGKGKADEKDKGGKKADKPDPGSLLEPGAHQSLAVLGIALIAMGEEIGAEMALRSINHLVSKPGPHFKLGHSAPSQGLTVCCCNQHGALDTCIKLQSNAKVFVKFILVFMSILSLRFQPVCARCSMLVTAAQGNASV